MCFPESNEHTLLPLKDDQIQINPFNSYPDNDDYKIDTCPKSS
jgi:hypothetical protein